MNLNKWYLTVIQYWALFHHDEVRLFGKGKIEIVNLTDSGVTVGRGILEPWWSWKKCVKPLVNTTSWQAPYTSYIISGELKLGWMMVQKLKVDLVILLLYRLDIIRGLSEMHHVLWSTLLVWGSLRRKKNEWVNSTKSTLLFVAWKTRLFYDRRLNRKMWYTYSM